jgi:hypothetical protein
MNENVTPGKRGIVVGDHEIEIRDGFITIVPVG